MEHYIVLSQRPNLILQPFILDINNKNFQNVDVDELGRSKVNLCKKCSESGVSNIVVFKILAKKSFKACAIIRKVNGR